MTTGVQTAATGTIAVGKVYTPSRPSGYVRDDVYGHYRADRAQTCANMNGRTFRLENAPPALEHPNCRRVITPITDPSELEDVA